MISLASILAQVVAGATFSCTPIAVWDGDGPIWCAEGPKVRLGGIAAREMDGTCRKGHPCPLASATAARDALVRLLGGPRGRLRTGHIAVRASTMTYLSHGSARGARTAALCSLPGVGDLSCAMVHSDRRAVGALRGFLAVQVRDQAQSAARGPVWPAPRRVQDCSLASRFSASFCSAPSALATAPPAGSCGALPARRSCDGSGFRPAPQTTSRPRQQVSQELDAGRRAAPDHNHPSYAVRHSFIGDGSSIRTAAAMLTGWPRQLTGSDPRRTSHGPRRAPISCASRRGARTTRKSCSAGSASCAPSIAQRADSRKAARVKSGARCEALRAPSASRTSTCGRARVACSGTTTRRVG